MSLKYGYCRIPVSWMRKLRDCLQREGNRVFCHVVVWKSHWECAQTRIWYYRRPYSSFYLTLAGCMAGVLSPALRFLQCQRLKLLLSQSPPVSVGNKPSCFFPINLVNSWPSASVFFCSCALRCTYCFEWSSNLLLLKSFLGGTAPDFWGLLCSQTRADCKWPALVWESWVQALHRQTFWLQTASDSIEELMDKWKSFFLSVFHRNSSSSPCVCMSWMLMLQWLWIELWRTLLAAALQHCARSL